MSRICIIGNSHIGAFRQAVDGGGIEGVSDRCNFETFGSIRASLSKTRITGGRLVALRGDVEKSFARTSGGQTEIVLDRYDGFIIAVRNSPYWIKPYLYDRNLGPMSADLVGSIHRGFLDDWSLDLTAAIAGAVGKVPVWFVGRPLNSEKDHQARGILKQLNGPEGAAAQAAKDQILRRLDRAVAENPVAENVTLVRPPDHLLEDHRLFTKHKYTRGAMEADTGMKRPSDKDDTMHMNAAYGREMLRHMLGEHG